MAFLGGAECSTAANPLTQFSKHTQNDQSLQRDRLAMGQAGGMQEGMRSQGMHLGGENMMDEFMQQPAQLQPGAAPSPWQMDSMRRELQHMSQQNGSSSWAADFDPGLQQQGEPMQANPMSAGFSSAEFARFQQATPIARSHSPMAATASQYQSPMSMGYGRIGMMGMQSNFMPMYQNSAPTQMADKGKGRMVELDDQDWEAQFAQLDQKDMDTEANEAIERELNDLDRLVLDDPQTSSETDQFGDFESIWRGIQAESTNNRTIADDQGYGNSMDFGDLDDWKDFDGLNTLGGLSPTFGDYMFEEQNPFEEVANPYEEGLRIMESGGNLSLAALAFEAAVQKDPKHTEAWVRLGSAQAQNEKESPAIRALEEALRVDPNNLEAMMSLAVSYTNENYETSAYRTLERWLATKYPQLINTPLDQPTDFGPTSRIALHEKVTNLYIAAAQLSPSGESMDPDVQVGLGVLFYAADEFDKAVDCFEAALASTEAGVVNNAANLHLLWNRLGATLANSGRSEEAIQAYERALEIRPNFVRARYNLGVSCINIGVLPEAAGHLLGALSMHDIVAREAREKAKELAGGGPGMSDDDLDRLLITHNESTNLYDTLRRVFTNMNRKELTDRVRPGMDLNSFRPEFDF